MIRSLLLLLHVVVCLAALTWPGHLVVQRWEATRPLGLPFWLAWHVGWLGATVIALAAYHLTARERQ